MDWPSITDRSNRTRLIESSFLGRRHLSRLLPIFYNGEQWDRVRKGFSFPFFVSVFWVLESQKFDVWVSPMCKGFKRGLRGSGRCPTPCHRKPGVKGIVRYLWTSTKHRSFNNGENEQRFYGRSVPRNVSFVLFKEIDRDVRPRLIFIRLIESQKETPPGVHVQRSRSGPTRRVHSLSLHWPTSH